jgi:hypothetical protein
MFFVALLVPAMGAYMASTALVQRVGESLNSNIGAPRYALTPGKQES